MKFLLSICICFSMTFCLADSAKPLSPDELKQFKDKAMEILDSSLCRERFKAYLIEKKGFKKHKAFLYVTDPTGQISFCTSVRQKTSEAAEKMVMKRCKHRKKKSKKLKSKAAPCQIFARNNTLLVSRDTFALPPIKKDLLYAAQRGDVEDVKALVEAGADVNQTNSLGASALLYAVEENELQTVKYLLSKGAEIQHKNKKGYDALLIATEKSYKNTFDTLIAAGADIKTSLPNSNEQIIHMAARYGDISILESLIKHGADIKQIDDSGQSLLHHALKVKAAYVPVVKYLVDKGIDVNLKNNAGKTALDLARKQRSKRSAKHLLKHGAKPGKDS